MPWNPDENKVLLSFFNSAFPSVNSADIHTVCRSNKFDYARCCAELMSFFPDDCVHEGVKSTAKDVGAAVAPYNNIIDGVFDNIMGPNQAEVRAAVDSVMLDRFGQLENDPLKAKLLELASRIYVTWIVDDAVPTTNVAEVMASTLMRARFDPDKSPTPTPKIHRKPAAERYSVVDLDSRLRPKGRPPDGRFSRYEWFFHFHAGRYVMEDTQSMARLTKACEHYDKSLSGDHIDRERARSLMLACRRQVEEEVFNLNNNKLNNQPWPLDEVLTVHINPHKSADCLHVDLHGLTTGTAVEVLSGLLKSLYRKALTAAAQSTGRSNCCPLLIHCGVGHHSHQGNVRLPGKIKFYLENSGVRWGYGRPAGVFVVDLLSCKPVV